MLQRHHIRVAVARELHAQAVARLARLAVADVVRQDDEVPLGVERLPLAEQPAAVGVAEESTAAAAGAVQDQHAVPHDAVGVFPRRAHGAVMNLDLGDAVAAREHVVAGDEIAVDGGGIGGLRRGGDRANQGRDGEGQQGARHARHATAIGG